jgi:hypothetical protein
LWQAGAPLEDFFGSFRNPQEYASFVNELVSQFSPWVKLDTIGTSYEGRPIQVIHISTGRREKEVEFGCFFDASPSHAQASRWISRRLLMVA